MSMSLFVERQRELQRYQEFLTKENPWVLIIRGLGGSGKSTLLSELEKRTPQDTCVVTLDFAQKTLREDDLKFLTEVSHQVEPYCEADRIVEFKRSITNGRANILRHVNNSDANNAQIIYVGPDAEARDVDLTIENRQARIIAEAHRQARETAREKFYAQMRTFSRRRLVIMLDTCEWLNEETKEAEAARWAGTEFIKGLRSRIQAQGQTCYVVMTSRVPLQLEGINNDEIELLRLKMLDKDEASSCLKGIQVQDPQVKDRIYDMTYGHPHSLSIVCDIYEEYWGDRPLNLADLPALQGLFYERALLDIVDKDILKRLLKSPLDLLTRYGILLRRFNLPLLQAVFTEWLPEAEAGKRFNQLVRYPHIEALGDYNYTFHRLLREILAGYIREQEPEKWRHYHHLALDFLAQIPARLSDWYYHLLAYDEDKGIAYWNEMKTRETPDYIDTLREVARDKTLKLTPVTLQSMGLKRDITGDLA